MTGPALVEVEADAADMRLDRWVRRAHPSLPQARIERLCRKGEIRVDGARAKPNTRLLPGQTVRLPPSIDAVSAPKGRARPAAVAADDPAAAALRAQVLYRDDAVLALNKPPGLAVQGGTKTERHIDALAAALTFDAAEPPRLVHRLDRDTSGVLLMARSRAAAARLARAFQARQSRKLYWAITAGVPTPRAGTIRYGVVKAGGPRQEKMEPVHPDRVGETEGAKPALTDYTTLASAAKRAAWVALSPVTGRTHQLRVHLAALGTPIAGDGKYGGRGQTNEGDGWGAQLGGSVSRKLHLHARAVRLTHPMTGKPLTITAPPPEHFARTLSLFGWHDADAPDDPFEEWT